jgi:hypothetical protein
MALPDSAKWTVGTAIILADTTDFSPTAANSFGSRTDQIDCTSLAAGAARQSTKFDFTANMDAEYTLAAAIEFATAPAAGEVVNFYIGYSNNGTAGTANPGGLGGTDAAYTGYSSNLADSLKQLDFIGSMSLTVQATTTIQIDTAVGTFSPRHRYGILVVENASAADAFHSDMVETSFAIIPRVLQIQD